MQDVNCTLFYFSYNCKGQGGHKILNKKNSVGVITCKGCGFIKFVEFYIHLNLDQKC